MDQKTFLITEEKLFGIKEPIYLNSGDTWEVRNESLVHAAEVTVEHAIGRKRLTLKNSEVIEIWVDTDNHENLEFKDYKEKLLNSYNRLLSLGIPAEYIYPKLTGRGVHLHVFISGLPPNFDPADLLMKATCKDADPVSLRQSQRVREFGACASTGKGYTTYAPDLSKLRNLPVCEETTYPELKVFKATKQFIATLSFIEMDQKQEHNEHEELVDYERDGDPQQLFKCPLLKQLSEKAKTKHHLYHNDRLFVMSQFLHFGDESRKIIHTIMNNCSDYDPDYTNQMIQHAMNSNYHPFTCKWAHDMALGCPADCQGSGGKSPLKFAWTPLKLSEVIEEYTKVLIINEEDFELIECVISLILDPKIPGEPSWAFVIAPSSSGKTVVLKSVHNSKWSYKLDSFSPKSLISGKTQLDKATGKEKPIEGLLPKLNGKTLIIKEFTTTLMRGEDVRFDIFGQLRAMYDRDYAAAFGSYDFADVPESWKNVKFGFIAGCTPYIDRYGSINIILGERFLKLRMSAPDRIKAGTWAAMSSFQHDYIEKTLCKKVTRFIANLQIPDNLQPPIPYIERLAYLSEMICQIRKPVSEKSSNFGLKTYDYEEATELPTRIVQQLVRLGTELMIVRGLTEWNDEIYKTICRVALDTLPPERCELIKYLYRQTKPQTQTTIENELNWGYNKTKHHLMEINVIRVALNTDNQDYYLNPEIRKIIDTAKIPQLLHAPKVSNQGTIEDCSSTTNIETLHTDLTVAGHGLFKTETTYESKNCDDWGVNIACTICDQRKTCSLPAYRITLIAFAAKCPSSKCVGAKCRECFAKQWRLWEVHR